MPFTFNPLSGKFDYYQAAVTDHGLLSGLTDDDHTQYALLSGRTTPQTLAFGNAASAATGYLTSTSDATKGKYFLNAAGTITIDELNTRIGVGTNAPDTGVHIKGSYSSGALSASKWFMAENTHSGGYVSMDWKNNSSELAQVLMAGSGFNNGIFTASSASLASSGAGGINIVAYGGSGIIRFATGGYQLTNEVARLTTSGQLLLGTTSSSQVFDVKKNQNGITRIAVSNSTSGSIAGAGFQVSLTNDYTDKLIQSFVASPSFSTDGLIVANSAVYYSYGMSAGLRIFTYNTADLILGTNKTARITCASGGGVSIGSHAPTARLHLAAGTATLNTAPLKFNSGTLLTAAEDGVIEYLTNQFYLRNDGLTLLSDSKKLVFGAGSDMTVWYDGTQGNIKTSDVTASDLHIQCGTDKTIVLDETVYDDLQFEISSGRVGVANFPDWDTSFTANTAEYKFDVDDYIDLGAEEVPHTWKTGTTGHCHLHLALDGANSSGSNQYAKFTVYIAYADVNEAWSEASPLTAEYTIPTGTADLTHLLLDMGDLTLTNQIIGNQIKVRVKRIAATGGTEYPNHIFVTQFGIHLEMDTMGSRTESNK